jgi:hypothetical protein
MSLLTYYPEMNQPKPQAQIEASLSYYGKHYFLYTTLTLAGRGIEYLKTCKAEDYRPGSHRIGQHQYKVTRRAFEAIKAQYDVSYEILLD